MKQYWCRAGILIFIVVSILCAAPSAFATELSIAGRSITAGESFTSKIMVDSVQKLAGIKIAILYDHTMLTYCGGVKSKETNSMMHVVNDTQPGRLVLVMAGAKGISGKNIPLFTFTFTARGSLSDSRETSFTITELQMMSDTLKKIDASYTTGSIVIIPEKAPPP